MGFKVIEGYEELFYTLVQAYEQATIGKGKVRHAKNGAAFEDQPLFTIAREHGLAFLTGQAAKKLSEIYSFLDDEADDTRYEKAYNELSGAIVYTAAAMMRIAEMEREQKNTDTEVKPPFPPPLSRIPEKWVCTHLAHPVAS